MASAAVRSKAVVLLLFINYLLLFPLYVEVCFVLQYFVSFLGLQSSRWGSESWSLNFCWVLNVMSLLLIFDTSSRCHGLVCSM